MRLLRVSKPIQCQYFVWKVFKRGPVYYADGRSSARNLGKHSLNARTEQEAIRNLHRLDRVKAQEVGLIEATPVAVSTENRVPITIEEGWEKFLEYCNRPSGLGGVSRNTSKKYKSVRDKHITFCRNVRVRTWQEFDKTQAEKYGRWLEKNEYAPRTFYFELTLLVSIVKWLVSEHLLDAAYRYQLKLSKPEGTDTYCYKLEEVRRMLEYCGETTSGQWIRPILVTLACTGMRIGELVALRWADIDFDAKTIHVVDNRFSSRKRKAATFRTTKGKRSRIVPLNPQLEEVLQELPRHPDGFVFHSMRGGKLRARKVLEVFIRDVREPLKEEFPVAEAEIGFKDGTIHSFRHYFVSESFRQGASEVEVMDWVGHRNSEMVHHYRHLRPDNNLRRMQSINFVGDSSVLSR